MGGASGSRHPWYVASPANLLVPIVVLLNVNMVGLYKNKSTGSSIEYLT